ncbi:uncharacterized protein SPSK_06746 [Sporothrix schenckii 1099-18]|uniref:Uncharacterized protein n=1 Tax=Sporothrix schenckii 1099-18 TaxID=1397361 RepID=A0A0F2MI52_SPOSC|nr:uncharacterized protein SPSK_06746 [Sporothrix schenckii 1099-18]KJR89312.1 hypothetical protein SPSK_06746 [Sporothrix schenckii 1099-18]
MSPIACKMPPNATQCHQTTTPGHTSSNHSTGCANESAQKGRLGRLGRLVCRGSLTRALVVLVSGFLVSGLGGCPERNSTTHPASSAGTRLSSLKLAKGSGLPMAATVTSALSTLSSKPTAG